MIKELLKEIKQITIIGVGLIGGSIGLALKDKFFDVKITGFGRNLKRLKLAKEKGCIDSYTLDLKKAVENSDLVIISTPVELIASFVTKILPYLKNGAKVIDVGSVKYEIIKKVSEVFKKYREEKNINFVGCHPIAGSEKTGFEFSNKDLFKNSVCVICYSKNLSSFDAYKKIKTFWKLLGAKTVKLDPLQHDKILSSTSHFLHIVSYLLVNHISKHKDYLNFTAGAYRDMTRIAASSPDLWSQICFMNRRFLVKDINNFVKMLNDVKNSINDEQKLYHIFLKAYKVKTKK